MLERLLIAGSGGQGVLVIGKLLAAIAANKVPHVTFFPSYGVEVRGGTSNCQVILSDEEIASPVAEYVDSMIIMNQASADRFLSRGVPDCIKLVNTSLSSVDKAYKAVGIRATDLANDLGNTCVANFIMLGAYQVRRPIMSSTDIEKGIEEIFTGRKSALVDLNIKAFRAGLKI
ncbi:MAG: 2-oxoacid:ferredoxin oxidoreductase subunit gamma [Verrucomicrobia bacterium]|nr:2-oxoacid:ferredoxin oxidoreductase subunit gamma [Verrucomicrobiota bacterium]